MSAALKPAVFPLPRAKRISQTLPRVSRPVVEEPRQLVLAVCVVVLVAPSASALRAGR